MKVVVDRFEGNYAVCEKEDGNMINIETATLPLKVKEGDVLSISGECISVDIEETVKRKKRIEKLTKDLWN
jgi:RNase P/RNase MRP subunit p29